MKVLGIDIGTTTISLVVLDPEQKKYGNPEPFPMEHLWRLRGNGNGYRM